MGPFNCSERFRRLKELREEPSQNRALGFGWFEAGVRQAGLQTYHGPLTVAVYIALSKSCE